MDAPTDLADLAVPDPCANIDACAASAIFMEWAVHAPFAITIGLVPLEEWLERSQLPVGDSWHAFLLTSVGFIGVAVVELVLGLVEDLVVLPRLDQRSASGEAVGCDDQTVAHHE